MNGNFDKKSQKINIVRFEEDYIQHLNGKLDPYFEDCTINGVDLKIFNQVQTLQNEIKRDQPGPSRSSIKLLDPSYIQLQPTTI